MVPTHVHTPFFKRDGYVVHFLQRTLVPSTHKSSSRGFNTFFWPQCTCLSEKVSDGGGHEAGEFRVGTGCASQGGAETGTGDTGGGWQAASALLLTSASVLSLRSDATYVLPSNSEIH